MINRRHLIAGVACSPIAATGLVAFAQSPSPEATPSESTAPTTDEVLPTWHDAQVALQAKGEAVSAAFWNGDADAIRDVATQQLRSAMAADFDVAAPISMYTENQVQFSIPELGVWFFGQYTPELMSGIFSQGGLLVWEATPEEPQTQDGPTGTWNGIIGEGVVDLGIILEFTGTPDALEATISIPVQRMLNHPLSSVSFAKDVPVGEIIEQRVLPAGGTVTPINDYSELYAWGSNALLLNTSWNEKGELAGFTLYPQGALPEGETPEPVIARLPFDGAWVVFWGGDTEFRNYHAATPQQRHAIDLMIWRDGSTGVEPGRRNDHYHAFGQPYLAPVDGTVVAVEDGNEDIRPQTLGSNPNTNPAGNHIVIETNGAYVFLAHCMNGSILVQHGDTVSAGDVVAAVGNSGNTSEPHVHIHAQTSPDIFDPTAVGVPIIFENALENGEPVDQLSVQQGTVVEHRP